MHDCASFDAIYKGVKEKTGDFGAVVIDAGYKTPGIRKELLDNVLPVSPYKRPISKKGFFKKYEYIYDEYYDSCICP